MRFPGLTLGLWEVSLWPQLKGPKLLPHWTLITGVGLRHSNQPNHKATGSPPRLLAGASGGQGGGGKTEAGILAGQLHSE